MTFGVLCIRLRAVPKLNETIAANIRHLMRERRLTQKQLVAAMGNYVTQATVSRILSGQPASYEVIQRIADALKVQLWRLVVEPDSKVIKMFDAWHAADDEGRDLIERQLERELGLSERRRR
jgi:transcriptional regulator with XRE-family HTH domain